MTRVLCISASYLNGRYHGHEWPPSPAKLFQALLAGGMAGCRAVTWTETNEGAMKWLERQPAPEIIAPPADEGSAYRLFVPNHDMDVLARDWAMGKQPGKTPEDLRTHKDVHPWVIEGWERGKATVHYLWRVEDAKWPEEFPHIEMLCRMARALLALGWGIDQVAGHGRILTEPEASSLDGVRYIPAKGEASQIMELRVPVPGFYDDLKRAFQAFCQRINPRGVDTSIRAQGYGLMGYRPATSLEYRHFVAFELRDERGRFRWVRWQDAMTVAAWLRHAVGEHLKLEGKPQDWIDSYVLGHGTGEARSKRLSYVPLPTIDHLYADGRVRRALVVQPFGDDGAVSEILAWRLTSMPLKDKDGEVCA